MPDKTLAPSGRIPTMFYGFIPVLAACLATILSLRDAAKARVMWIVSTVLVAVWSVFHGSHHLASLATYGSW